MKKTVRNVTAAVLTAVMALSLCACGGSGAASSSAAGSAQTETGSGSGMSSQVQTQEQAEDASAGDAVSVNVFAAASLRAVMEEFEVSYEAAHPGVDIVLNTDSSGTLLTQIQEGAPCDIFFSAAQKQMDTLEGEEMVVEGSRTNVVNNQLVVITQPDSQTSVTGLSDIGSAAKNT